jgi:hypothetical protein
MKPRAGATDRDVTRRRASGLHSHAERGSELPLGTNEGRRSERSDGERTGSYTPRGSLPGTLRKRRKRGLARCLSVQKKIETPPPHTDRVGYNAIGVRRVGFAAPDGTYPAVLRLQGIITD